MILRIRAAPLWVLLLSISALFTLTRASVGDRLPEFRDCVDTCIEVNCGPKNPTPLALHLRLLLWTCPSECDYTCQHLTTTHRLSLSPPPPHPVVQYHGKWPFIRFLGAQEPLSVLFSLLNLLAHLSGLQRIRREIPASYPLKPYYLWFGYFGVLSWTCSAIFHTRDFPATETADYLAAGASVLYGFYFAPLRVFRLVDTSSPSSFSTQPSTTPLIRAWTTLTTLLFLAHTSYLLLWHWDYTYNMAFNVALGLLTNLQWTYFSITHYARTHRLWAAWPGLIVAWVLCAMSFELLDFPPVGLDLGIWGRRNVNGGWLDAHALWHAGTVAPTVWWYSFLVRDALEDLRGQRLKA